MPRHSLLNAAALTVLPLSRISAFFPMLRHWVFNAAALKLLPVSVFLPMLRHWVTNAAAFILFSIFVPFCILSFFFSFPRSSYHLQHKIPRKCVQNDNNTNKITKYEALKHIKYHSYHPSLCFPPNDLFDQLKYCVARRLASRLLTWPLCEARNSASTTAGKS